MKLLRYTLWTVGLLALLVVMALVYLATVMAPSEESWEPAIGAAPAAQAKPRTPCADRSEVRNPYFGDLHVHTTYSWDGAGRGMQTTPEQAYRFARGEALGLPPYDAEGVGTRKVQLDRPLDFAAVTDHAESIGEVKLCITPGSARFDSDICRAFRGEDKFGLLPKALSPMAALRSGTRSADFCGDNMAECRAASLSAWELMQIAAEDYYDRSDDCSFTTFHGYEYTWAPGANRVHRNVIFRNEVVPELPVSAIDENAPEGLWRRLKELCLDTDGDCDALAIPHNPNHSSGRMFPPSDPSEPLEARRARAELAAQMEPIVEMMQIKGESECRNGLWGVTGAPDEFCDLEKYSAPGAKDCEGGTGIGYSFGRGCVSRTNFARYAIAEGMAQERELGVNPYRLGFIGSTDTHNGIPGDVEERNWAGSTGLIDAKVENRLKQRIQRNPGGLVGVWAEENSREALFDAMRRREVFATSGTRMTMRFFAGWDDFASAGETGQDWCDRPDALQAGYKEGVPMGEVLSGKSGQSPFFAISAQRDPGTPEFPGGLLQRVQVIKVTAQDDGNFHQEVFDVAGGPNDASVDLDNCRPHGIGADQLCAVWQDPGFDAAQSSAYYVRVIENPSCRWTQWTCLSLPKEERPAACQDPDEPRTTQERAWSSPIWYTPG